MQRHPVTVGASGMGCPSIGIYSYELYNEFDVDCIIRIGTAGAYTDQIKIYDVINVDTAYSEPMLVKLWLCGRSCGTPGHGVYADQSGRPRRLVFL